MNINLKELSEKQIEILIFNLKEEIKELKNLLKINKETLKLTVNSNELNENCKECEFSYRLFKNILKENKIIMEKNYFLKNILGKIFLTNNNIFKKFNDKFENLKYKYAIYLNNLKNEEKKDNLNKKSSKNFFSKSKLTENEDNEKDSILDQEKIQYQMEIKTLEKDLEDYKLKNNWLKLELEKIKNLLLNKNKNIKIFQDSILNKEKSQRDINLNTTYDYDFLNNINIDIDINKHILADKDDKISELTKINNKLIAIIQAISASNIPKVLKKQLKKSKSMYYKEKLLKLKNNKISRENCIIILKNMHKKLDEKIDDMVDKIWNLENYKFNNFQENMNFKVNFNQSF